ncbi:translation initiation factor IF-2 [Candidatus Gottesmanbacteria bacterium]|nr:translation initiation factor IF-2 [Candidatus Gottesmanbacteria bacterium]
MKKPSLRPPIVVVLGHVDHGKTTLLDYIRKTNVAAREPGEITQHIGAYQVNVKTQNSNVKTITFIDTPGHEAFAKMRSRGARVADLAVLVVAANDGVMPQTQEAIRHIKQAKIPMIVAINKIDLPGINLEKIKKQLVKEGVALEGYGGEVVVVPISAKTGEGIKDLLEMIILVSEMEKLEGDPQGPLQAIVIESKLDPRRGPVASLLIKNGTFHQGDEVVVEQTKGKVRAMIDERGERLKEAGPGTPVEILGLETVPQVGAVLTKEGVKKEEEEMVVKPSIEKRVEEAGLKIILKTDVLGTLEAIAVSLEKKKIEIISSGTGDITEGDVFLAKTTGAIIIGFNIKISPSVAKLAETEKVKIKTYQIIYELLEEITEVVEALLVPPKEEFLGKAEIIAEFAVKKGKIAGCKVVQGRLAVGDKIKILRGEEQIGQARIKFLKQQKEAIDKAELGEECGVLFEPLLDFAIGDIVISHRL